MLGGEVGHVYGEDTLTVDKHVLLESETDIIEGSHHVPIHEAAACRIQVIGELWAGVVLHAEVMLEAVDRGYVHELHADVLTSKDFIRNRDGVFYAVVSLLYRGDALGNFHHVLLVLLGLVIELYTIKLIRVLF